MRQLLSHQAGVRHYRISWRPPFFTENGSNQEFGSVRQGLSMFLDDPVLFAPDASFQYSTFGYSLASLVMEHASGEPFLALMERLVCAPLQMVSTGGDRTSPAPPRRSTDYLAPVRGWGVMPTPPTNSSDKWAGGGLVSTPADLAVFGQALLAGDLVSAAQLEEMTTPRMMADGRINPQSYGLGWRSGKLTYPRQSDTTTSLVHHGGTALGSECVLVLMPAYRMVVSACGNANTGGSTELLRLAADLARDFLDGRSPVGQPGA